MSIILLLKDIKLVPATTLLLRNIVILPDQFYPILARSIPHPQMHVLEPTFVKHFSLAVAFGETHL
jgi:hypothetical protein